MTEHEIESFWDLAYASGDYLEHWESPHIPQELVTVVAADLIPAGATVLDVGCGAGAESIFLARCGFRAIGVDSSEKALLIARELRFSRRWLPYLAASLLIAPIALSRVYLGAQWFSDILAGLSLGIIWVALIGIAYDRHPAPRLQSDPRRTRVCTLRSQPASYIHGMIGEDDISARSFDAEEGLHHFFCSGGNGIIFCHDGAGQPDHLLHIHEKYG